MSARFAVLRLVTTPCLEENEVVDFVAGNLEEQARHAVETHLDSCARCLSLVSEFARVFAPQREDATTEGGKDNADLSKTNSLSTPATIAFEALPLPRGTRLGRYVVLDVIGSGGMGVVYTAFDPELDRKVAVKVLRDKRLGAAQRGRLQREARAMARLSHPNVISVHDVGVTGERIFVAMEFVDGGTLKDWLEAERRSVPEILMRLIAAGKGLAAAHEAGLVHRDFKPANVLVGEDGRVRVTDFGLARPSSPNDAPATDGSSSDVDASSLNVSLTETGALVGTPAYMSPEQHEGRTADARSDQFSFCVTAFEALHRERPFPGRTYAELAANVSSGEVREPVESSGVPKWIDRALRRGLEGDPMQRFPDMASLLKALRHDPRRRWRRWASVAVPAAAVGAVGVAATIGSANDTPCTTGSERLDGVWDPNLRRDVAARFAESAAPFAADSWHTTERLLDAYTQAWLTMHSEACEATYVHREQSEALFDLRVRCLAGRRDAVGALAQVLSNADTGVIERSVDAVLKLPALEVCADADHLTAVVPRPEDPAVAEQVRGLEKQLARANAEFNAGRYDTARDEAQAVVTAAAALGYAPLHARALVRLASIGEGAENEDERAKLLQAAINVAVEGRDDRAAASSALALVHVLASSPKRLDEADAWVRLAESLLRRLGGDADLEVGLLTQQGFLARSRGDLNAALGLMERALELTVRTHGQEHPRVGVAASNAGQMLHWLGRLDEAQALYERGVAIDEAARGPDHPLVTLGLNNLGAVLQQKGEYDRALDLLERALATREQVWGKGNPRTLSAVLNVGATLQALGRTADAQRHYANALEIAGSAHGDHDIRYAAVLSHLGGARLQEVEYSAALEKYAEALAIHEAAQGPDHFETAMARYNMAEALERTGALEEAKAAYEHARRVFEASVGPDHATTGSAIAGLGRVALAKGDAGAAIESLERALELNTAHEADAVEVAGIRFSLARALAADNRDPTRAAALLEAATKAARDAGPRGAELLGRITAD